jgi:hypothetical protein
VLGALLAVCLVVFLVVGAWVSLRTVFGWLRGMLP